MSFFSGLYPWFKIDQLNGFIAAAITVFFAVIAVYSAAFMRGRKDIFQYYVYITLTALVSVATVLANHLLLLLVFWGFLGLLLYLLILMGDDDAYLAAKKTLVIVGGSDALMVLGIGIIYSLSGTFQMDTIRLATQGPAGGLTMAAYLCVVCACFAKAGAMPFHTWIPDCAKCAPAPVVALLPASLDKLLGIYLLARLSFDMIAINPALNAFLMVIGALTILCAVMMALVQHNLKRLLGYHAVSQVGYMILGIGTGNPIGIAGGIFHMLNHAVYKSCLFLNAGSVERQAKTTELDELGGLSKAMPFTYVATLIASLSISGVPPFNGFFSKWLIYQGLVIRIAEQGTFAQLALNVFCLACAMFGSGLTLASFMKLMHAVFMGQGSGKTKGVTEAPRAMWVPSMFLAATCVAFGVFAFLIPLKMWIFPAVARYQAVSQALLPGAWPGLAALAVIAVVFIIGIIVFRSGRLPAPMRTDAAFVGGEAGEPNTETRVTGTDFYNAVQDLKAVRLVYRRAQKGSFDIYVQAKRSFSLSYALSYLHNGILPTYLVWVLLGMLGMFWVLLK